MNVKRGDIGSTMAAYADAWAGDSPLAADAVTASPYLGFGSLQPLLDTAAAHDRGQSPGMALHRPCLQPQELGC